MLLCLLPKYNISNIIINSTGMKNIVTAKGDMDKKSTQISQANGGGFSKGNAVLNGALFANYKYHLDYNLNKLLII